MQLLYLLIEIIVKCFVVFACLWVAIAYEVWFMRKMAGRIQLRYGPNRCGPYGLLQPFSDLFKALFKEDLIPERADKAVFVLSPMITIIASLSLFAVIPFGNQFVFPWTDYVVKLRIADIDVGLLYIFGIASLGEFGIILAGWSSGNKYGLLGSLRAAAQMISYEVALGLSIVGVLILSQSLSLPEIINHQAGGFWSWNIWYQPVAFILYLICGLAEMNKIPFDMPEAEAELACGYNIEYSSMKFALFYLSEFFHMTAIGAVAVTLFLGGWQPLIPQLSFIPGVIWFCIKLFIIVFLFMWQQWTYPRLRYDQIMKFGWKILFPLALVNLVITSLVVALKG
jgi:NADH-quinone oxidoreductase subunit H